MTSKGLKMCRACRGLIAADSTTCPLCGAEGHYARRAPVSLSGLSNVLTVNNLLILTNLLIYALVLAYQSDIVPPPSRGNELAALSPYGAILSFLGDVSRQSVLGAGQYWRLITACFLHGGLLHIGFNSFALYRAGSIAEEEYGGAKFLCLYLITGVFGNLLVVAFSKSPAVGASGAICGIIGAMAVYGYRRADTFGRNLKSYMVQWIIMIVIISLLPEISFWAHAGGLISGAAMGYFLTDVTRTHDSLKTVRLWQIGAAICIVLTGVSFVFGAINGRKSAEAYRLTNLSVAVYRPVAYYLLWSQVPESEFEEYKQTFASEITTLENIEGIDEESSSLRDHLLEILHDRRNQLHNVTSFSDASPDRSKVIDMNKTYNQFKDWARRKAQSLGLAEDQVLPHSGSTDDENPQGPRS
ncbi:MAG TPA: rhomboid family intramembrane serine protease [Blastocatellia bacterium]|nr:rhomboid family intramembrane serine protease [Blastocatellia bacterium]